MSLAGFRRLFCTSALACCFAISGYSQSTYGALRGMVTDSSGAAVPTVKVTLTDEATNAARSTLTTSAGEYSFSAVVPSSYTITSEAPGFKKFEHRGVTVATQQSLTVDLKMELGQVTDS